MGGCQHLHKPQRPPALRLTPRPHLVRPYSFNYSPCNVYYLCQDLASSTIRFPLYRLYLILFLFFFAVVESNLVTFLPYWFEFLVLSSLYHLSSPLLLFVHLCLHSHIRLCYNLFNLSFSSLRYIFFFFSFFFSFTPYYLFL